MQNSPLQATLDVPSVDDSSGLMLLPFVLSMVAGSTDVIGFLGLGGLLTAHITGNLVILVARIVANDPLPLSYLIAVPLFVIVLGMTRLLVAALEQIGVGCALGAACEPAFGLQSLALPTGFALLAFVLGLVASLRHSVSHNSLLGATLSSPMGTLTGSRRSELRSQITDSGAPEPAPTD